MRKISKQELESITETLKTHFPQISLGEDSDWGIILIIGGVYYASDRELVMVCETDEETTTITNTYEHSISQLLN